jgi:hypothetical protein
MSGSCRLIFSESSSQPGNQPKNQRKGNAQNYRSHYGKVKGAAAAFDGNIARKSSKAKWEARTEQQECSKGDEHQAADQKPLTQLASWIHGDLIQK